MNNKTIRFYSVLNIENKSYLYTDIELTNLKSIEVLQWFIYYLSDKLEIYYLPNIKPRISDINFWTTFDNYKEQILNGVTLTHVNFFLKYCQKEFVNEQVELANIYYHSIIELDKLKEKNIIEYFGLNIDGTLSKNDKIPVYFKVDLVRLIILLQLIKENPQSYAIYADIDTKPLSEDIIFTEESIKLLNRYGLVLPKGQLAEYENSFHILAGEELTSDKYMRISIEKILVEFNIYKILYNYKVEPQDVFGNYKDMFLFYFAIFNDKQIKFNYLKSFNSLRLPPNLNKNILLNLDIQQVAYYYTDHFYGPTTRVGLQLFNFSDRINDKFELKYPIRQDLGEISPHHYNYNKKYLLYK
jgi:hypothetical protein